MAVNPDPRPGRWILPLVVLGMIAFTYFFVRALPEASTETTLVAGPETTTTLGSGDGSTSTTGGETTLDPETQAYLDSLDQINADLQVQRTEMITVNDLFNEDPRGIEFSDAEDRFEAVLAAVQALADQHRELAPPEALTDNHALLQTAIDSAASSVSEALEGLRSTDTGQLRNSAVQSLDAAAGDYDTEVTNAKNVANA